MEHKKERFFILDLLRGLAVLLMVLAHVVYFFHNRDNSFLLGLEKIGNTFCFTAFLLVSGAVSFIAYLKDDDRSETSFRRIGRRVLTFLLAYYLLALFVSFKEISFADLWGKIEIIFGILTFRLLPSYTEFFPPFIIFPFLLVVFHGFFKKIARNIWSVIGVSGLIYLVGYLLYRLSVPESILPWKAFLSGAEGFYRFPILQYLPVYLIGLFWGSRLIHLPGLKPKKKFAFALAGITALILAAVIIIGNIFSIPFASLFLRWPPAPGFILVGLVAAFLIGYLFYLAKRLNPIPILRDFLLVLGQNAFAIFWAHIFLLSLYQMAGGGRVSSVLIVLFAFVVVIILSLALATFLPFNFKFVLTFVTGSKEEAEEALEKEPIVQLGEEIALETRKEAHWLKRFFLPRDDGTPRHHRLLKKRHLLGGAIIGLLVAAFFLPSIIHETEVFIKSGKDAYWWNDEFAYRQNFVIKNQEAFSNISKGQLIEITLNHRKLIAEKKANLNGSDIRAVYFDGKNYILLPLSLRTNWNQNETILDFASPVNIGGGESDNAFFIYYGDSIANVGAAGAAGDPSLAKYGIEWKKEDPFPLLAKVSRRWNLIGKDKSISLTLENNREFDNPVATYHVLGTAVAGQMENISGTGFEGEISLDGLVGGKYQVQVDISEGDKIFSSQKVGFYLSDPLYVAWTIDWEGYDASNAYLDALADISRTYGAPMTHFWNPRIYVTSEVSAERQKFLTDWVKARLAKGDAIGLHTHMFYDLVQSAGVEPKHDPNWGDEGNGYGVPTSAYPADELGKILQKSVSLMTENGLPQPFVYRAGGWFASLETLTALEENGFLADSSGRTSYSFGRNNLKGDWDLKPETQPYRPSRTDQNESSFNNAFNLLEIPNNGADSYWFSAEDMIKRFEVNYAGGFLDEKKEVTFLTHPHWFKTEEQQKVRTLFDYLSNFNYDDDSGPVVYTTTPDIYKIWMAD